MGTDAQARDDPSLRGSVAAPGRPQVFYIQVDEEDAGMFRSFLDGAREPDHVWGMHSREGEAWRAIRPGDIVYIGMSTESKLVVCGMVSRTSKDREISKAWGRAGAPGMDLFIHFSHLRPVQVLFKFLNMHAHMWRGFEYTVYQVVDNSVDDVMYEWPMRDPIFVPPDVIPPVDYISPPDTTRYVTVRAVRDTAATRRLREKYGNRCQACGYALKDATGQLCSEVHHLRPLHEGGTDTPDNMLVLCPRHHAELDYGAACVDGSGRAMRGGSIDGQGLRFEPDHRLAAGNVAHGMQRARPTKG